MLWMRSATTTTTGKRENSRVLGFAGLSQAQQAATAQGKLESAAIPSKPKHGHTLAFDNLSYLHGQTPMC
eukprot:3036306-Amphidinium_carterae.2